MNGTLYIVAAPSGSGKTSLVNALLEREPGIGLSVSYTSRLPRPGEVDGKHYHFVSRQIFERMVMAGAFYEHANVHGDLKGTARSAVEPLLAEGRDVLLEIDWQGARQVRKAQPTASACSSCLRRARNSSVACARARPTTRRRSHVGSPIRAEEIADAGDFDYLIVNDQFADALADLRAIVTTRRLRREAQLVRHAALIEDLLKPA